jgi:hypothetical protein
MRKWFNLVTPKSLTRLFGMTKIAAIADPLPTKRGRKPKLDAERVVKKTVSLQPSTFEGLMALGEGVLSRGIEAMYELNRAARKRRS